MKRLNKVASQLAAEFNLSGGTDITGYSLLGHGMEMSNASGIALQLDFAKIPFLKSAREYAGRGIFPGGAFDNKKHFEPQVRFSGSLEEADQMLLFDPQTSGGLLLGVPEKQLDTFLRRAEEMGQACWTIGRVEQGNGIVVR
jgi:selenide,water dikinase